ncbi:MAG: hypothetical protein WBP26_05770 [Candidatus Saccharimonadales bacterium]
MRAPSSLDYSNTPGVWAALKLLIKSILRYAYLNLYRLPTDKPIKNGHGLEGLFIIASYTDNDKAYLEGFIAASQAFEGIILYHDKTKNHRFAYNESLRFQQLVAAAKRHGARWVLVGSPKTRFSKEFKNQIAPLIKEYSGTQTVLSLKERYLWNDFDHYTLPKIASVEATIEKLFTVTDNMVFDNKILHASQRPINYTNIIKTSASRYYLGRFNVKMMKEKADFYHHKDGKDYSYLCDVFEPMLHGETILGIGQYEKQELLTWPHQS